MGVKATNFVIPGDDVELGDVYISFTEEPIHIFPEKENNRYLVVSNYRVYADHEKKLPYLVRLPVQGYTSVEVYNPYNVIYDALKDILCATGWIDIK